ncbi:MAG TPA: hypothetical protein VG498_05700 [Terriglobales bacterium]|nr:hypothetical protein [Terriglobales bacterium]
MRPIVFLLFLVAGFAQSAPQESAHVRRTGHITLHGSVDKVFPLFGPTDEAKWAPGWEPSIKYIGNGELGAVFTTGGSPRTTWIVSRYESKAHDRQYTVFFPEDRVVQLDVTCRALSAGATSCEIAYALTAITAAARQAVGSYTQEEHDKRIAHWQLAINHYLETGTRIEHHD